MAEPTWQDIYDIGKATIQTRRPTLSVQEGDVSDAIIAGTATMATAVIGYANQRFLATFLDSSFGDDLTARAHDEGVDRSQGTPAVGFVTLSRASASLGAGTIPAGTKISTAPDSTGVFIQAKLDVDAVFGGSTLFVNTSATAVEIGRAGNVDAGLFSRFVDPIFDPSILPSNSQIFAGGLEVESDEDLRDRVRGFRLTEARGTDDALIFGAKQTPGVARVSVSVDAVGIVTVFVADADGNSNAKLVANAQAEIEHWRGAGDIVNVTGGVIALQAVSVQVTVRLGTDILALIDRIRQAIVSRLLRLEPGETLYPNMISAAVAAVDLESITQVVVITPAVAITPPIDTLIRTNIGLISVSG